MVASWAACWSLSGVPAEPVFASQAQRVRVYARVRGWFNASSQTRPISASAQSPRLRCRSSLVDHRLDEVAASQGEQEADLCRAPRMSGKRVRSHSLSPLSHLFTQLHPLHGLIRHGLQPRSMSSNQSRSCRKEGAPRGSNTSTSRPTRNRITNRNRSGHRPN